MVSNKRSLKEIIEEKKLLLKQQQEALEQQKQKEEDRKILPPIEKIVTTSLPSEGIPAGGFLKPKAEGRYDNNSDNNNDSSASPSFSSKNPSQPPMKLSLKEKIALLKAIGTADLTSNEVRKEEVPTIQTISTIQTSSQQPISYKEGKVERLETFSNSIELNSQQLLARDMAFAGKSFCIIGAAGSGKTTAQKVIAASLLESGTLSTHEFRIQGEGLRVLAPSIAFIAYTRIASGNLKRAIHKDPALESVLVHNITTFHNLLEYTPETYWDMDEGKEKFRFLPKRNRENPLDITHLVIEEASMLGLDHWEVLYKAMRGGVQIIFIGDINQLQPVFGPSILNYALTQLPVVELTQIYRQAGDSTILENAHNILAGKNLVRADDFQIVTSGTVNHTQAKLAISYGSLTFPKWINAGVYDPLQDIILSPWNKRDLGTDNLNKWIAQSLGTQRQAVVYEVLAGITKLYLAVGDKVMYNKQVGIITKIYPNIKYMGKAPKTPSVNLNRFGSYSSAMEEEEDLDSLDYSSLDLDKLLEEEEKGDKVQASSHIVEIQLEDIEISLSAVGDFSASSFTLAYALTVHKAQGCEWRKVFLFLHRDHAVSLHRELLYTAVTRAREAVIIIAKEDVIERTIKNQKIKGNSLQDKIEYFNSSVKILNNAVRCTK